MGAPRTPPPGRAMMWLALAIALVIVLLVAAGCARPTKTITFQADSVPPGGGLIVHIDMTFTGGSENAGGQYPFDTALGAPFYHFQVAEIGTVASYLLTIFPIEPGQVVTCWTTIDVLQVDRHAATFPNAAVCGGPPV